MKKLLLGLVMAFIFPMAAQSQVSEEAQARWTTAQAANLESWVRRAAEEAIVLPHATTANLNAAINTGQGEVLNRAANAAALELLSAYHGMCCGAALPTNWHISQGLAIGDLQGEINRAVTQDRLDLLLRAERVRHPHYRAIAAAYSAEPDEARRQLLARNLARWRTLAIPRHGRYLIVNIAAQELMLWNGDDPVDTWRVIVGKTSSRTPVFQTEVTGVVLNPWWNIPASIAAEGIGAFVRRDPVAARARGYIYSGGRYRQMPGDNNALGRMKLVMPNPYSVLLHDTSNRELFQLEERMRSHGCIRVDRALQFATVLLNDAGWTAEMVDQVVASNETQTVALGRPIPLFIAYFTVAPDDAGFVRELPDAYRRDLSAERVGEAALRRFAYPLPDRAVLSDCSGGPNAV